MRSIPVTGVMFSYYFICHRKLWHFYHGINLENFHENVILGRLLDEKSNKRENKNILFDGVINIDFLREWKVLYEVKKSKSLEESGKWQLKYYIYYLLKKGVQIEKGILEYPLLKKREEIFLEEKDKVEIERILEEIRKIIILESPPKVINNKICKKCAYYEYCYI